MYGYQARLLYSRVLLLQLNIPQIDERRGFPGLLADIEAKTEKKAKFNGRVDLVLADGAPRPSAQPPALRAGASDPQRGASDPARSRGTATVSQEWQ